MPCLVPAVALSQPWDCEAMTLRPGEWPRVPMERQTHRRMHRRPGIGDRRSARRTGARLTWFWFPIDIRCRFRRWPPIVCGAVLCINTADGWQVFEKVKGIEDLGVVRCLDIHNYMREKVIGTGFEFGRLALILICPNGSTWLTWHDSWDFAFCKSRSRVR